MKRGSLAPYLPWLALQAPFDAGTITVEHLLTHTSGFPCDTLLPCRAATRGARQAWFAANPQPLWAPPGTAFDYSNFGFVLASLAVTSAAGTTDDQYEALVHDLVFVPAGMATATFDSAAAAAGDHASGHILNASHVVTGRLEPTTNDCPLLHPSGGILATASDYAHFAEALIAGGGSMLHPASVAAMESAHQGLRTFDSQAYGYGLDTQDYPYRGHALVWHDGSWAGFLSSTFVVPDFGFAVVTMLNAIGNRASAENINVSALQRFLAQSRQWPVLKTAPALWSPYAGTYDDPFGELGTVTVTVGPDAGGTTQVVVDAPDAKKNGVAAPISGAMTQSAGDAWAMPDGTGATFFPDASGVPTYFVTRRGVGVRQ